MCENRAMKRLSNMPPWLPMLGAAIGFLFAVVGVAIGAPDWMIWITALSVCVAIGWWYAEGEADDNDHTS